MLSLEQAQAIAREHVATLEEARRDGVLFRLTDGGAPVGEGRRGWAFNYQSPRYLESGEFSERLVGHGPFVVDRETGQVAEFGSSPDEWRRYEEHLDRAD